MKKNTISLVVLLLLISCWTFAQEKKAKINGISTKNVAEKSSPITTKSKGLVHFNKVPNLTTNSYSLNNNSVKSAPYLGVNFAGNVCDGTTPPDNSIAISDNGYIVSVMNSNIEVYDNYGNYYMGGTFSDLIQDTSYTEDIHTPVVIYDSGYDRFILAALHGKTPSTSIRR